MALVRLRPPHGARAQLDRQPVDQPRDLALARGLFDQALLRGAQIFGPVRLKREGIEAELRIEHRRFIREQALQVLGIAAGDRRCDARLGDAAVDAEAAERQPPSAEMPFLKLRDELGNQPLERLRGRFGMRCGFLEPQRRARRRFDGRRGQRLRLAADQPIERVDDISPRPGTAAPARAAEGRMSAPIVLSPSRSSVRTVSGSSRSAETWRGASCSNKSLSPCGRGCRA